MKFKEGDDVRIIENPYKHKDYEGMYGVVAYVDENHGFLSDGVEVYFNEIDETVYFIEDEIEKVEG